jgi:hypothetical protein
MFMFSRHSFRNQARGEEEANEPPPPLPKIHFNFPLYCRIGVGLIKIVLGKFMTKNQNYLLLRLSVLL